MVWHDSWADTPLSGLSYTAIARVEGLQFRVDLAVGHDRNDGDGDDNVALIMRGHGS